MLDQLVMISIASYEQSSDSKVPDAVLSSFAPTLTWQLPWSMVTVMILAATLPVPLAVGLAVMVAVAVLVLVLVWVTWANAV